MYLKREMLHLSAYVDAASLAARAGQPCRLPKFARAIACRVSSTLWMRLPGTSAGIKICSCTERLHGCSIIHNLQCLRTMRSYLKPIKALEGMVMGFHSSGSWNAGLMMQPQGLRVHKRPPSPWGKMRLRVQSLSYPVLDAFEMPPVVPLRTRGAVLVNMLQ